LSSANYKVTAIKKPTKAVLFGDVKVGDELKFTMKMQHVGNGYQGRTYASTVGVHNLTQGTYDGSKSQSEVTKILQRSFEIEPVDRND
jgi:hypothetical protein